MTWNPKQADGFHHSQIPANQLADLRVAHEQLLKEHAELKSLHDSSESALAQINAKTNGELVELHADHEALKKDHGALKLSNMAAIDENKKLHDDLIHGDGVIESLQKVHAEEYAKIESLTLERDNLGKVVEDFKNIIAARDRTLASQEDARKKSLEEIREREIKIEVLTGLIPKPQDFKVLETYSPRALWESQSPIERFKASMKSRHVIIKTEHGIKIVPLSPNQKHSNFVAVAPPGVRPGDEGFLRVNQAGNIVLDHEAHKAHHEARLKAAAETSEWNRQGPIERFKSNLWRKK